MSLRTDYYDGATGYDTKMNAVHDAGVAFVTSNLSAITSGLTENAAKGLRTFTIQIATTFETANLRLTSGNHATIFLSGITAGLMNEDIYPNECVPSVNTDDNSTLYIDLDFTF